MKAMRKRAVGLLLILGAHVSADDVTVVSKRIDAGCSKAGPGPARIIVTAVDMTGVVIPGAEVRLQSASGERLKTLTAGNGTAVQDVAGAGMYTVRVSL